MANISLDLVRGDLSGISLIEMLYRWFKKYQVLDGYAISAQGTPNNTVQIDAGTSLYDGQPVRRAAAGNITFATCSETQYRIDLLYAKDDGTVGIHQGDNAAKLDQQGLDNWRQYIEPYIKASCPDGAILGCVLVKPRAGGSPVIEAGDIWSWGPQSGYGVVPYMYSVSIAARGTVIYATDAWGQIISSGVLGTDDTDVFDAAVAECPDDGSIFIGPGTYTLEANKLFYLSGDGTTNPHYYAFGPAMEGKNCHVFGAGIDVTILKLADSQHYTDHKAILVLNRTTGDVNNGFTSFTMTNLTLDGNRANQTILTDIDGPGNYLSGSIRECEWIYNVKSINSAGHGFYLGNNGSGPVAGAILSGLYIENCYRSGICTDTGQDVAISNCVIIDCSTGLEVLGNTDYATRDFDNISITNVVCRRAGFTVWCINGLAMSNCSMDINDVAVASYGLQIHCSKNIIISDSQFRANQVSQYVAYIDGGGYINDGVYSEVYLKDCIFDGYWAIKLFGAAVIYADDCTFAGYTKVEGEVRTPGACIYMKEFSEVITAKMNLKDCKFIPGSTDTYIIYSNGQTGTAIYLTRCQALSIGAFDIGGFTYAKDCDGPGLEGYNGFWRLEEGSYNSTPASTSTLTMTANRTAVIKVGTPLKYYIGGTAYYGIVTAITSNLLTIAGAPLSSTIQYLMLGTPEMVAQVDYLISGIFDDAASSTLIQTKQKSRSYWRGRPAYLVKIGHLASTADSGTAPKVTASLGGSVVGTDNSNTGLAVGTSLSNTVVGINTSNYKVEDGEEIELKTTEGGSKDATYLTVFLTFVSE